MDRQHASEQIKHRWIQGIRSGDAEDYESLSAAYSKSMYYVTNDILRNETLAQKAVQITFRSMNRLLMAGARFGNFDFWLFAVARNNAMALADVFSSQEAKDDPKLAEYLLGIMSNVRSDKSELVAYCYDKVCAAVATVIHEQSERDAVVSVIYKNMFDLLANGASPKNFNSWVYWLAINNAVSFGASFYPELPKTEWNKDAVYNAVQNAAHQTSGKATEAVRPAAASPKRRAEPVQTQRQRSAVPVQATPSERPEKSLSTPATPDAKKPPQAALRESDEPSAGSLRISGIAVENAFTAEQEEPRNGADDNSARKEAYSSEEFRAAFSGNASTEYADTSKNRLQTVSSASSHAGEPMNNSIDRTRRPSAFIRVMELLVTVLLISAILILLWVLVGLLMKNDILPSANLGYRWFNEHLFTLF